MQKFYYLLFWLLNLLLTPLFPCLSVYLLASMLSFNDYSNTSLSNKDLLFVFFFIALLCLYYLLKIIILPLISGFCKNDYISSFFERIKYEKRYRNKVILLAILLDSVILLILLYDTLFFDIKEFTNAFFISYLISGGGLLLSYLSLIVWLKFKK